MKKKKIKILILALFFVTNYTYAHKNIQVKRNFGNVSFTFTTEWYVEEINKGIIISKYTRLLVAKMHYEKKIRLIFIHSNLNYTKFEEVRYSYQKDNKALTLVLKDTLYDIDKTLRFIYHSISNENQHDAFSDISSIDTNEMINSILKIKIYRPDIVKALTFKYKLISYYAQNNKLYLYYTNANNENILTEADHLYRLFEIDRVHYSVFINKSTFLLFNYADKSQKVYHLKHSFNDIEVIETHLLTPKLLSISIMSIYKDVDLIIVNLKKNIIFENINKLFENTSQAIKQ